MNIKYMNKLVALLNEKNIDAALIIPSEDLKFLLGHSPYLCERFQGLFVKNDGEYFYFCNLLTKDEAEAVLGKEHVFTWFDNDIMTEKLEVVLEKQGLLGATIAVNSKARAFNILEIMEKINVNFVNGKELMEEVTLIKDIEEIDKLKKAAAKTDIVMQKSIEFIKPGIKELDIKNIVFKYFKEEGMYPEFAIIASGSNSAYPHYVNYDRTIEENDIIIIDIGGVFEGVNSDMTRTVFVGEATDEMKKVYEIVLKANLAGEKSAKKGISVEEVDRAARDVIDEAGYGQYFTTRLGHGIGYSTHEAPYIKQNSKMLLDEGMAFSIEPGIYIPEKFGVRIEDIVVITQKGTEIINKTSKDIICIK